MIHQTIQLPVNYAGKINNGNQKPYLTTYLMESCEELNKNRKRPLVLICPGGGYVYQSAREAEPIALRMNALGFQAAILYYSVKGMDFPAAACDLAEAIYYARSHADEWHIYADQIILCGFSAGGHLCASLGCYWNSGLLQEYLPYKAADIKPNALLLAYPVITADSNYCHEGSIENVLGSKSADREKVSLELHVTKDMPPVFMWHTFEDQAVPLENTLLFANALRKAGVQFEYHLFARGSHGLALANDETSEGRPELEVDECQCWPELFAAWYKGQQK